MYLEKDARNISFFFFFQEFRKKYENSCLITAKD